MNDEVEYFADYQDIVAQRTLAFCRLAQVTDAAKDERVRELCIAMLQKISASIRTPASAEIRLIGEGDADRDVVR